MRRVTLTVTVVLVLFVEFVPFVGVVELVLFLVSVPHHCGKRAHALEAPLPDATCQWARTSTHGGQAHLVGLAWASRSLRQ